MHQHLYLYICSLSLTHFLVIISVFFFISFLCTLLYLGESYYEELWCMQTNSKKLFSMHKNCWWWWLLFFFYWLWKWQKFSRVLTVFFLLLFISLTRNYAPEIGGNEKSFLLLHFCLFLNEAYVRNEKLSSLSTLKLNFHSYCSPKLNFSYVFFLSSFSSFYFFLCFQHNINNNKHLPIFQNIREFSQNVQWKFITFDVFTFWRIL